MFYAAHSHEGEGWVRGVARTDAEGFFAFRNVPEAVDCGGLRGARDREGRWTRRGFPGVWADWCEYVLSLPPPEPQPPPTVEGKGASAPEPPRGPWRGSGTRSLSGVVVRGPGGGPAPGAVLEWMAGWDREFRDWRCVAVADGAGRFRASGLEEEGTLRARAPGCSPGECPVAAESAGEGLRLVLGPPEPPPAEPGPPPPDASLPPFAPARTIEGRVEDETGAPLEGASVTLTDGRPGGRGGDLRTTHADAEGRFLLLAVPPGRHGISVHGPGRDWSTGTVAAVEAGARDLLVTLRPRPSRTALPPPEGPSPPGVVRGRVLDEEGNPVPGIEALVEDRLFGSRKSTGRILLASLPRSRRGSSTTDGEGRFEVGGLDLEGSYEVSVGSGIVPPLPGGWAPARLEGVPPDGCEVLLRIGRGLPLRGVVVDGEGRPLEGARVESGWPGVRALSGADGSFSLTGFVPWQEDVEVRVLSPSADLLSLRLRVARPGGDPLRIVLPSSASLRGVVLDGSGKPAPGLRVEAAAPGSEEVPEFRSAPFGSAAATRTGHDGRFTIRGLDPKATFGLSVHREREGGKAAWTGTGFRCGPEEVRILMKGPEAR